MSKNAVLEKKKTETLKLVEVMADMMPAIIVIHELPEMKLKFMSPLGVKFLGREWSEIESMSSEEYQKVFFNNNTEQEQVPKILGLLQRNEKDEVVSYFQQVRTSKTSEWDWYMSVTKVLLRDENNAPHWIITNAMKIDPEHYFTSKATRLLEENSFLREHFHEFARLTKREIEILKLLAQGRSTADIAKELTISEATAETHRKNIRRKVKINSPYDLYMYAQAFNLR